jgi:peptidoglycan/xylan/chitin deacetylase (PgdA/CDA1 family)
VSCWLDPLRAALDASEGDVRFFFRDDDAGWGDDALERLLEVFEPHGLPLDVAAIPAALTPRTIALLTARGAGGRNDVTVHQHGFAHVNHEPAGRKCEFGASRSREQQAEDIAAGRQRLHDLVGDLVAGDIPAVFTPPWNRCAPWTGEVLRELGFTVLSRDRSAGPAGVPGLQEMPVTADWFAKRNKVPVDRTSRGVLLAERALEPEPVGVMLHHEVMSEQDLDDLGALLAVLAAHPAASAAHLHELALSPA